MIKYCLVGRHSHRTPLSYSVLHSSFKDIFVQVENYKDADIMVLGFVIDLKDNLQSISEFLKFVPHGKIVVLSEEPLWDTIWGGDYIPINQIRIIEDKQIEFLYFNHANTKCFEFAKIPYFIRTDLNYVNRYANLFSRNSRYDISELGDIFQARHSSLVAYAEKRLDDKFDFYDSSNDIRGLSKFRTDFSNAVSSKMLVTQIGAGWTQGPKRQQLVDWHLDKIVGASERYLFSSALENTHLDCYVTEKFFDSMATLTVPVYFASPSHLINNLCDRRSFINLYGLTVEESVTKVLSFDVNNDFLKSYKSDQEKLFKIFSDFNLIAFENKIFYRALYESMVNFL